MKQTGQTWNKKQILWAVILGLALCFVFALVYKAQLAYFIPDMTFILFAGSPPNIATSPGF